MREEYVKNRFEVDGVTVYESAEEFVFSAKNERGEAIEHRITKVSPFPIGKDKEPEKDIKKILRASVNFPNLPTSKALEELAKKEKKK